MSYLANLEIKVKVLGNRAFRRIMELPFNPYTAVGNEMRLETSGGEITVSINKVTYVETKGKIRDGFFLVCCFLEEGTSSQLENDADYETG